jgi:NADH-dependent flavin oxidoreductase
MKLFEEIKTKNISFKNRIIMPSMATSKADDMGHVSDDLLDYYQEKTSNKLFSTYILKFKLHYIPSRLSE